MKVVLINPPVGAERYKSNQSCIPRAGLGYLASYLEKNSIHCDVIDGKFEWLSVEDICNKVSATKPEIVGFSAMTPDIFAASNIAKRIKEVMPDIFIVLGGAHAIAMPRESLNEFPEIDFVVTGEGEETLVELVNSISGARNYREISGLGFRKGKEIVINPSRGYIRNPDSLPFPAWDKFKNNSNTYFVLSSRGCPYQCSFCMRSSGNVVRDRTPENVVKEIEWLVEKFNPKKIIFIDETFTLRKAKVLELTSLLLKKGLNKKIKWVAQTRVDKRDPEVFARMKEAGCEQIEFGVESGNQQILNNVDKSITLTQVEETVKLARKTGLFIACTFIIGHPYETEETIKDTINFAVKLKPDFVSFGIMSPYPGTKIWDMARVGEGNYRLLSHNWEEYTRFGGGCLELTNLPRKRLEVLQVKAYVSFYLRTFKIIRFIQYSLPRLKQSKVVLKKAFFGKV
ncbi:anaerobic magnesium-protoporphyrin IX monomethyl ester cyclase, elongator protein 3/MiaB/NifB family [Candidatus Scalindua japonica]|uniref:Anaerobic magnesium-protoporphyrin IX monomethyl ester cyclase, elongator protein 3/MiaB/NifB family n=1 Tax=Candidatus Scalindua japonica TaxID=1284222 RepID=A0A286TTJ6_9BACT|nr:radical SAM protein [Candidatus Scalindua japonica]GAX59196.1 anaerobic magnesium-protoporphyrin IX monomethyl ester cyclase, elongator protein 3/MiaB/NifB family [Candidatus Scalindua japonica]